MKEMQMKIKMHLFPLVEFMDSLGIYPGTIIPARNTTYYLSVCLLSVHVARISPPREAGLCLVHCCPRAQERVQAQGDAQPVFLE